MKCRREGRRRSPALAAALAAGLVLGASTGALSRTPGHVEEPPLEHTGGFDGKTCHACHFDNPINDPSGELGIEGVPDVYRAGRSYPIRITLAHPELERGGFQLAARFAGGENEGGQAGVLRSPENGATVAAAPSGVLYAHHTKRGVTPSESGTSRWLVEWRAPEAATADVVFHIAANAANYDDSELGDFVYIDEIRTKAAHDEAPTSSPRMKTACGAARADTDEGEEY